MTETGSGEMGDKGKNDSDVFSAQSEIASSNQDAGNEKAHASGNVRIQLFHVKALSPWLTAHSKL